MFPSLSTRAKYMEPILENLENLLLPDEVNEVKIMKANSTHSTHDMGDRDTDSTAGTVTEKGPSTSHNSKAPILVHTISSTGLANYASTLNAYRLRYNQPLPHQLLICDSTPGSPAHSHKTIKCWSRGMTTGTAKFFPWPAVVTHFIWYILLWINVFWLFITRREAPGKFTVTAIDDETMETKKAKRMFMYSKEDELILAEDIEELSDETRRKGYEIRRELFVGSRHVRHMQKRPEQYWRAIDEEWRWSAEERLHEEFKVEIIVGGTSIV